MDAPPEITIETPDRETLQLRLSGNWTMRCGLPSVEPVEACLHEANGVRQVVFETSQLGEWDTSLLVFLMAVQDLCRQRALESDDRGLPPGIQHLLKLATGVAEFDGAAEPAPAGTIWARTGALSIRQYRRAKESVAFVGDLVIAMSRFCRGRARYRAIDLWITVQEAGAEALPIVTLIAILVGLIMAFVGAVQLRPFGAQIYVANLVGLAMAREMGAMMTAIIMAGRTGAAFAAQIGTMTANEEVDALRTLGISPMEFLVLPRVLALTLMMPILVLFADLMGMLGGAFVAVTMLDLAPQQYLAQTIAGVRLGDFAQGWIKGIVFGVLVATAGCLRGMQSGRTSAAVGKATTSAVVTAIVWIVVWDAAFAIVFNALGW